MSPVKECPQCGAHADLEPADSGSFVDGIQVSSATPAYWHCDDCGWSEDDEPDDGSNDEPDPSPVQPFGGMAGEVKDFAFREPIQEGGTT